MITYTISETNENYLTLRGCDGSCFKIFRGEYTLINQNMHREKYPRKEQVINFDSFFDDNNELFI